MSDRVDKRLWRPVGFRKTSLGLCNGCNAQYEKIIGEGRIHVKEYDDRYEMHVDKVAPSVDPVGHLVNDAKVWYILVETVIDSLIKHLIGR